MARKRRTWLAQHFYHVVCRGNRRDALFKDTSDFQTFLYILQEVYEKITFEICSYCFMTNHYHLQIRSQDQPLSKVMSLINKKYANYYNTSYKLSGHVYEKRYYDKMIDSKSGMLEVSRYIHLNPYAANMVKSPVDYYWSSFGLFQKGVVSEQPYMNINVLLDYFAGTSDEQKIQYCQFIKDGIVCKTP